MLDNRKKEYLSKSPRFNSPTSPKKSVLKDIVIPAINNSPTSPKKSVFNSPTSPRKSAVRLPNEN